MSRSWSRVADLDQILSSPFWPAFSLKHRHCFLPRLKSFLDLSPPWPDCQPCWSSYSRIHAWQEVLIRRCRLCGQKGNCSPWRSSRKNLEEVQLNHISPHEDNVGISPVYRRWAVETLLIINMSICHYTLLTSHVTVTVTVSVMVTVTITLLCWMSSVLKSKGDDQ